MPDFFTHDEIAAVIDPNQTFRPFLLELAFGREYITNDRKISFDNLPIDKRIAVFQSPRTIGKVNRVRGFEVSQIEPGYMKPKNSVDPDHVFTRMAGEPMLAPLTPEARYNATVIDLAYKQGVRISRTQEVMASQLLRDGRYTMEGEGIDIDVNFDRKAENTMTLVGGAMWSVAPNSCIDTIEDALALSEGVTVGIVMGATAWSKFRKDSGFKDLINKDYQSGAQSTLQFGPMQENQGLPEGVIFRGTLASSSTPIYTYTASYVDPLTGDDTKYVDPNDVLLIPAASGGWRGYAAIWDVAANYMGMPVFYKNWAEQDPGTPFMMTQSAPALAHVDINSTVVINTEG